MNMNHSNSNDINFSTSYDLNNDSHDNNMSFSDTDYNSDTSVSFYTNGEVKPRKGSDKCFKMMTLFESCC